MTHFFIALNLFNALYDSGIGSVALFVRYRSKFGIHSLLDEFSSLKTWSSEIQLIDIKII